jgi:hypothetical protein
MVLSRSHVGEAKGLGEAGDLVDFPNPPST